MNYKIILSLTIVLAIAAILVVIGQTRSAKSQNDQAANKTVGNGKSVAPTVSNETTAVKTDEYKGEKIVKTEAEWRKQLTAQQFYVLREKGTPYAELQLDDRTGVELETAQRFRSRADGGRDTVYLRLWLHRDLAKGLTLSGAVEQRWNEGQEEQRLHQQLSYRRGVWRGRSRLEQRFVEDDARAAVRLRQRFGIEAPLGDRLWSAQANAEGFFTLRTGAPGRQTGLTGLRTYAGLAYEVSDRVTLGLGYVRAQDIRSGRPDRVSHAPLLSLDASF